MNCYFQKCILPSLPYSSILLRLYKAPLTTPYYSTVFSYPIYHLNPHLITISRSYILSHCIYLNSFSFDDDSTVVPSEALLLSSVSKYVGTTCATTSPTPHRIEPVIAFVITGLAWRCPSYH